MPMDLLADPMGYLGARLAVPLPPLVLVIGNSNVAGQGNAMNINGVREFGVATAFPSVTLAAVRAPNTNDPPSFNADTPIQLDAYNPGLQPGFGPSVTLGHQLFEISPSFAYIVEQSIVSSFLATHWLPTATYMLASTGKNLYNTARDRARAYETSTGREVQIIYVCLGTNDASDSTAANAMDTNMGVMCDQLHADFPNAKIVWPLVASGTVQTFLTTTRTKMLSFATAALSARPYFVMPNIDYAGMRDPFHWDDNAILRIGNQWAFAGADLRGIPRRSVTSVTLVGRGVAAQGNASTLTALSWAGIQDRHTELLWAIASGQTPAGGASTQTISDPAGWTLRTQGQTTTGTGGFTGTWKVWGRPVGAGEVGTNSVPPSVDSRAPSVSVNFANSSENYLQRFAYDGPNAHPSFNAAVSMDALNAFDNSAHTISAFNTTADGALVTYFVGGESFPTGNTATLTAAGLTGVANFTETAHLMPDTGNVLASVWTGSKAVQGPTGTASVTTSINTLLCIAAVAMVP